MNTNLAAKMPLTQNEGRGVKLKSWRAESLDILLRAEGVELTNELREAVNQKIGRVRQYAPRAFRARVQLHRITERPSPNQFRARVHYEIPGNDLVAEHSAHDPLVALDLVAEKIERRLRRRKTARLARRVREYRTQARRRPVTAHV